MTAPEAGVPFDELSDAQKIARLHYCLHTLTEWLVQAQTGFGHGDVVAMSNLIDFGQTKRPTGH